MNKKKLKDVDIFQRTLCCHPLPPKEKVVEIQEAEMEKVEEEEEAIIPEEEELDLNRLMQEMECMKRRIQMMQIMLKAKLPECPDEDCVDFETILHCSKNKEICTLQKNQHKLQCQINDLVKCCKVAKEQIQNLYLLMSEKNKEISEINESIKTLMEWRDTLQHEFGKCLERFEYLKHVKAEWRDVNDKLEQQHKCFSSIKDTFLHKSCFQQEKKTFVSVINELRQMLNELCQYQFERFAKLEKLMRNSPETEKSERKFK